jgi:protein TonB
MRGIAEAAVFGGLALALHLGGVAALASFGAVGSTADGSRGQAMITIEGGAPAARALVARWSAPPEAGLAPGAVHEIPATGAAPPDRPLASDAPPPAPEAPAALPAAAVADPAPIRLPVPPPQASSGAPPRVVRGAVQPDLRAESVVPKTRPKPDRKPDPEPTTESAPEPAPENRSHPAAASPALRASGAGGGVAAGVSGASEQAAAEEGRAQLLALWGGRIRAEVERRKHYPRAAGGAEGTAVLRIAMAPDGRLQGAALSRSAGHPALDRAALGAVRGARFPPAPQGLGKGPHEFTFQMTFAP